MLKSVLDKRLLKDMKKLAKFCHTGNLEVYHSLMTNISKRQHFSYNYMLARIQLAALDHNHNIDNKQQLVKESDVTRLTFPRPPKPG